MFPQNPDTIQSSPWMDPTLPWNTSNAIIVLPVVHYMYIQQIKNRLTVGCNVQMFIERKSSSSFI